MSDRKPNKGLGRGLRALFTANTPAKDHPVSQHIVQAGSSTATLALEKIVPNPDQPRKAFDEHCGTQGEGGRPEGHSRRRRGSGEKMAEPRFGKSRFPA